MKKSWLLVALGVISAAGLLAKAIADYDHSVNFGKYHTYSWLGVNVEEPLWNDRVRNAIDNQLVARGWRKVDSGGDAMVSAFASTRTERTLETWYGVCSDTLTGNPDKNEKKMEKAVAEVFKKFPPPEKG